MDDDDEETEDQEEEVSDAEVKLLGLRLNILL